MIHFVYMMFLGMHKNWEGKYLKRSENAHCRLTISLLDKYIYRLLHIFLFHNSKSQKS